MTYTTREESVDQGTPFECYKFVSPVGTYRYTSLPFAVSLGTGDAGAMEEYTPLAILRSAVEISTIVDTLQTMDLSIPIENELAQAYLSRNVPEYLTTRVYRAHYGDDLSTEFVTEWRGEATGYSYEPGTLVVETQSILQSQVLGVGSAVYCQLSCNHRVYDDQCQAVEADHTHWTTVTSIDNVKIDVETQGYADNELQLGRMVNVRTGEERTIYDNVSGTITLTYPFLDIIVGDYISLILGCDNTMSTCINRFDNVINFLGFRYVPLENIFIDDGDKVVKQTTTKREFVATNWVDSSRSS